MPLQLIDKGRTVKGLVASNDWTLEPLKRTLNGLALGYYQPSH